jgi:hypothetical protein
MSDDLFTTAEIDRRKGQLHQLFQQSILGVAERDPGQHFWQQSLKVVCDRCLDEETHAALDQYADELHDWLALNYPTKHWISVGIYTRIDHILSVH